MNINNKINKINKLIINNKELLNIKYKERNELLENKIVKHDDLDKLDKYVESIEFENERLEKELEELKKLYNLDINIKKEKTQLCRFFKTPKGCDKGTKCKFAHGEIELKKVIKPCISGSECYKKDCKYYHPKDWNYKNNIKICEFFKNGYCINENNCRFEHVKDNYEIGDNNIEGNINKDIDHYENKYNYIKDIVKGFIHEDIIYGIIEDNKKHNIDSNNLSLNVKFIVDGIEYKNFENIFNNYNENDKVEFGNISYGYQESDNISGTIELINNLQNDFNRYIKDIKRNIDDVFINDKEKYGIYLKSELNKIMSELLLFKNNFEDITNTTKNKE